MTTSQPDGNSTVPDNAQTLKRRGLLALAAAFVGALVAKVTEAPVSAGSDGDVVLGGFNTTTSLTTIQSTAANGLALQCVGGAGSFGVGLYGTAGQYGVRGDGNQAGVLGTSVASGGY